MKVEIRSSGEAVVSGYVNAVERFSKPLKGKLLLKKYKVERLMKL